MKIIFNNEEKKNEEITPLIEEFSNLLTEEEKCAI